MAPEAKTYSLDECKQHTTDKDCWLIVHGKVYNVTDFLEEHPGGYDIILTSAGEPGLPFATACCMDPRQ
jgi:cytochrome b involved in lipid metabolism